MLKRAANAILMTLLMCLFFTVPALAGVGMDVDKTTSGLSTDPWKVTDCSWGTDANGTNNGFSLQYADTGSKAYVWFDFKAPASGGWLTVGCSEWPSDEKYEVMTADKKTYDKTTGEKYYLKANEAVSVRVTRPDLYGDCYLNFKLHAHNYSGSWTSHSATQHKQKCSACDSYRYANHNFTNDGTTNTCSVCSYKTKTTGSDTKNLKSGTIYTTKINNNQATIRVYVPSGATTTEIWCNNKKIKTVKKTTYYTQKTKGAGKASYKIRSSYNVGGALKYSAFSKAKKPQANVKVYKDAGTHNVKKICSYGNSTQQTYKLFFSGSTLKCTAYIYNNRMFKLKKIKIKYYLKINKKVYKKTITKTVNVKAYGKKKITYVLGKGVSDLANGTMYKKVSTSGNWGFGWNK